MTYDKQGAETSGKSTISRSIFSSMIIIIVAFLAVVFQVVDRSAGDTFGSSMGGVESFSILAIYSAITITSLAIQGYFLVASTRIVFKVKKATSHRGIVITCLYLASHLTILGLIGYLLGEQIVLSRYHIMLSELIVGLSLIISTIILLSLAFTLLKFYSNTKNRMIAVYAVAIIALSVQLVSASFYVEVSFYNTPEYITQDRNPWASFLTLSLQRNAHSFYEASKTISFIAVWIASVLLTKQYAQKMSKIKYWIIVSIPVAYFLLQYSPLLLTYTGTLNPLIMAEGPIFLYSYNFVLNTVNVGTGILFGISFIIVSKSLVYSHLKYYVIICGTGIMIIFSSSISTILILAPFPAWAIVSISFVLPASFLILIGIDSATYYIASDKMVRGFLHRYRSQFELFHKMGAAEAADTVERKIRQVSEKISKSLENETLFKPESESENIKQYVTEAISELRRSGTRRGENTSKD